MSLWPVTLALGVGGAKALLLAGMAPPAGSLLALSPTRTLSPLHLSGYAGRDFPPLSVDADDLFAIDLGPALGDGDALDPGGLTLLFYAVEGGGSLAGVIDGAAGLVGTVAAQAIGHPPAGRYLLGFACRTTGGRTIEIHSFFNATSLPDAAL